MTWGLLGRPARCYPPTRDTIDRIVTRYEVDIMDRPSHTRTHQDVGMMVSSTMITIIPYSKEDQEESLSFLAETFRDDVQSQQYFVLTKAQMSYVARTTEGIVGLAALWDNPVHPDASRCAVAVHPNYRKMGVGSRLFGAITDGYKGRPLVTSLWDTQIVGKKFATSHGFCEFRRTYTVSLRLPDWDRSRIRCQPIPPDTDYKICALSDVMTRREKEAVAVLCKEIYTYTHRDNPPADESVGRWMGRVFTDDLIEEASFVVSHKGRPIAMALLYQGQDPHMLEMGWRGTSGDRNIGKAYVEALSTMQVEYAVAMGAESLILESDSTDPWSERIRQWFPFAPATAWITMKRG